jgi:bacterioferritin-associated ferredoxin
LIGICGASGLVFVYGIGSTLSVFADVTSPLLSQTVVLADNAQRVRTVFLDAVNKNDNTAFGESRGKLGDLGVAAGQGMEKVRHLLEHCPCGWTKCGSCKTNFTKFISPVDGSQAATDCVPGRAGAVDGF